jgi:dolichyl-phosphate beta-glucosyltransferase
METQAFPSLTVVLPTFNESHRLPQTLREIKGYLHERFPVHEVIVVDDGSKDGTGEIVEDWARSWPQLSLIRQPRNFGKGAAVRRGCLAGTCDVVLFMDADHATPIESIESMLNHIGPGRYGAVVGVRTYQEDESKWRRIVGLSLQILAHLIVFERAVVDSQCGFKCFSRDVARRIFSLQKTDGGMFDVELFFLMHRLNIPVYYEPVRWKNKDGSRINFLKCFFLDPIDLIRIRWRGLAGTYSRVSSQAGALK